MAIAKMVLVSISGDRKDLDDALLCCTHSGIFHPEQTSALAEYSAPPPPLPGTSAYTSLTTKLQDYVTSADVQLSQLTDRQKEMEQDLLSQQNSIKFMEHLSSLDVKFDDLWTCQYLKVRFGRLPQESYGKLQFYKDQPFAFFSFDHDDDYHWCMYITANAYKTEIDTLFSSLFFERIHLPDCAHDTPEQVVAAMRREMEEQQERLALVKKDVDSWNDANGARLATVKNELMFMQGAFELRKYVGYSGKKFTLLGFIPADKEAEFLSLFKGLDVLVTTRPGDSDARLNPPVQLKNNRFTKSFEMFVTMYGLPSYKDIDPTPYVAITYTLLFGIMFGDLGQGLLLSLIGILMWKWKRMGLGKVLTRIGLSSAVFGCLYGSVFGYEHLLDPIYHALGFAEKPLEVMDPTTTSSLLVGAVGLGSLLIICSILINIALGIKRKEWGRALLSNNGVAGLVFYCSVLAAAVSSLVFQVNLLHLPFVLLCLVLPLVVIFFQEPLTKLIAHRHHVFEAGFGAFFVETFFEMFEVLLSFVTNTMSFLRVGGFILSHAGMMLVVMTLSEMVGSGASILVVVIGNLFVMAMEGLIVGIQVLRLEYYEIFSRFYDGGGEPYTPFAVENPLSTEEKAG